MNKFQIVFLFLLVFIFSYQNKACALNPKTEIWAASDSIKIFKDSPRQAENAVWSSKDNIIRIKGARNETISFQLVIYADYKGLNEVTVIPSVLKSQDNVSIIPKGKVNLFLEWYTLANDSKDSRYYPDALIPFYDPYGAERNVIAAFFNIKPNENQPVWVDIEIPKDIAAGDYKGTLDIVSKGKTLKTIDLILSVFTFSIPNERHITAYSEMYGFNKKMENLDGGSEDEIWDVKKEYWIMARKHRFDISTTGYELDPSASSRWNENGTYKLDLNTWVNYDKYIGQIISGDIFPDKLPPNVWRLPFPEAKTTILWQINCKYSSSSTWDKPNGCYKKNYIYWQNMIKSLAKAIEEHFSEKEMRGEWPKGTLDKSFVYIIDEPKQYSYHYPYIKDYSMLIKEAAPKIKFMLTEQPEEPLFGYVDIWASIPSALAPQRIAERQKEDEKVWFYQGGEPYLGSVLLTADAISLRMWAWTAWKYGVDGVFLWAIDFWSSNNPYTDPQFYIYNKPIGNFGDGYIFYPGGMLERLGFSNIKGPVSSIRMKMWRRGFLDYEYMWLAKQNGKEKEANAIINSMVKSALVENYKEVTDPIACAKKKFDGQKTKFLNGKCIGACSDYTNKTCWYNDGIVIGPWDCDDGPDESGKYPQSWQDPRAKKFNGWSKNPDEWVQARYKLAQLIKTENIEPKQYKSSDEPPIIYKRELDTAKSNEQLDSFIQELAKKNNQVIEDFSQPIEATNGRSFGKNGQLTFELYRGGTFVIDGKSGFAWQKSDNYGDVAIIRSTKPLPKTYKISVVIGDIDYGLDKIQGLENDPLYKEGPLNENGAYLLAITDEEPIGHHINDWWHQHRKVCIDVDNNIWAAGMPNPVFMVYFDNENKLVTFNTKEDQWKYKWDKAVTYEPKKWYVVEIEKTEDTFILCIYDSNGKILSGGIVPLTRVWHEEGKHLDYFVIGDPHENYYQGSMKIKAILIRAGK